MVAPDDVTRNKQQTPNLRNCMIHSCHIVFQSPVMLISFVVLILYVLLTYPAAQLPLAVPPLLEHSLDVKHVPFRADLFETNGEPSIV